MKKSSVTIIIAMMLPMALLFGLLVVAPRNQHADVEKPGLSSQPPAGSTAPTPAAATPGATPETGGAAAPGGPPKSPLPAPPAAEAPTEPVRDAEVHPLVPVAGSAPSQMVVVEEPQIIGQDAWGRPLDTFAKELINRRGIAGEVVMNGHPVTGATVVLRRVSTTVADGVSDYRSVVADAPVSDAWTTTTAPGPVSRCNFMFTGLQAGHYAIEAYTDTACGVDDIPVRPSSIPGVDPTGVKYFSVRSELSIELRPSAPLQGRVLAPDGVPVAGAVVYPTAVEYLRESATLDPIPTAFLSTCTAADGTFQFPRLVAGQWQLAVHAAGYAPYVSPWIVTGGPPVDLHLGSASASNATGGTPNEFRLSDYRGKFVLLDFWASWCVPCRLDMPNIHAVYDAYRDDPRLMVIGMNLDSNRNEAEKYIAENQVNWKQFLLGDWSQAPAAKQFRVDAIPKTILINPDGTVLFDNLGGTAAWKAVHDALEAPLEGVDTAVAAVSAAQPPPLASGEVRPHVIPAGTDATITLNIDRDFDYVPEGFPMGMSVGQTEAPAFADVPYEPLTAEPVYRSPHVRYGCLLLGNSEDNRISLVLDGPEQKTFVAYIDRNNNEDLTDDGPPIRNEGTGQFAAVFDVEVPVVLASGRSIQRPYRLWLWASVNGASFYTRCHFKAVVQLGGLMTTAIAFEQFHHDALYKESGIWVDLNGDGRLDEKTENFASGSTVMIDGQAYRINLDYP